MAILRNQSKNNVICSEVEIASSFFARAQGLLGTKKLSPNKTLWIHRCNNIHTFFMNYAIDCVFVDHKLKVCAVAENVHPWRIVLPKWKARSVFEMSAGLAKSAQIEVGDQLHVGN